MLDRRMVLAGTMAAAAFAAPSQAAAAARPFALNYAPNESHFKASAGPTVIERIAMAADQGFRAWEDNLAGRRPVAQQEAIGRALADRGMTMGVFVAQVPDFAARTPVLTGQDNAPRVAFLADLREAVPTARRLGARWITVAPGFVDGRRPRVHQFAALIDLLRHGCDIVEPHGLIMVVEPLNARRNHPGVLVRTIEEVHLLCRAVNRPSCKVLADLYHQQIEGGNLIPALDAAWDEIAYVQVGDTPGRTEPGTGEINYRTIFAHLKAKGYQGVVGLEHGLSIPGAAGERRLAAAYRDVDPR